MKFVDLPVELSRDLLQSWLGVIAWVRLDSALCSKSDRSAVLSVVSKLQINDGDFSWNTADLCFAWCAGRNIKVCNFVVGGVSNQSVDVLQFKNSATASGLTTLKYEPGLRERLGWVLNLVSICPNIQRLGLYNTTHDQVPQLNKWCSNLSSLLLSHSEVLGHNPYNFSSFLALKKLCIISEGINQLILPQQLEEFTFRGSIRDEKLGSALGSCPNLTKLRVTIDAWDDRGLSNEVLEMLPPTMTALKFTGCSELDFVLEKFTRLTELTVSGCQDISQEEFDGLFMLPCITYLALECYNESNEPEIESLSDGIECPTLRYLIMESFESMQDDAITSIVQRCPNLTYVRLEYMGDQVSFPNLQDDGWRDFTEPY